MNTVADLEKVGVRGPEARTSVTNRLAISLSYGGVPLPEGGKNQSPTGLQARPLADFIRAGLALLFPARVGVALAKG
jgi:hypothetical protein